MKGIVDQEIILIDISFCLLLLRREMKSEIKGDVRFGAFGWKRLQSYNGTTAETGNGY